MFRTVFSDHLVIFPIVLLGAATDHVAENDKNKSTKVEYSKKFPLLLDVHKKSLFAGIAVET